MHAAPAPARMARITGLRSRRGNSILNIPRLLLLSLTSVIGACIATSTFACDEAGGIEQLKAGNYDKAYQLLSPCETRQDVSADTLIGLAILYGSRDYEGLEDRESEARAWTLLHRAALLGSLDATMEIAQLYQIGNRLIDLSPDEAKAQCLDRAAELPTDDARGKAVGKCLQER